MHALGDYKLLEQTAEGGMATVYRAVQTSLDRQVAIKVLSRELMSSPEIIRRFAQESLIIARLNHPNIIHVIDRGIDKGMPYFVMDFVEGQDLERLIAAEGWDTNRKLDVIIQVCKALAYAHRNGVVHRDIKPANILIDEDGNALVSDFGIAQIFRDTAAKLETTQVGTMMGTPSYMSPEQRLDPSNTTGASDIYSLGVVMYEWFTGTRPVGRFKRPSELDPMIPASLEDIIMRCLETEPKARFDSADELKDRLLDLLRGAHIRPAKQEAALQGITGLKDKFSLVDVIREHKLSATYLFEEKTHHRLMVIKKIRGKEQRGLREAKLLTTLSHPNIAQIIGTSGRQGLFIIVLEYLAEGSLQDRIAMPWSWQKALGTTRQICEGLSFAHRNRIIHGNLRPSNILFNNSGEIKISDFGLPAHYRGGENEENWYRIKNEPASVASDIYAIGTILCQLVIGTPTPTDIHGEAKNEDFTHLPVAIQDLINKMISPQATQRYSNIEQVISGIDEILRLEQANKPQGIFARLRAAIFG
ncbi:MAG: protein kinase [Gammaproteobacteria bacterium]|nr:protein kinase [Gammaproteobacteria bacterium]